MSTWQSLSERADAFVLGLMDDSERAKAERDIDTDHAFAREVGAARDRFLELDLAGPAASVPADLWTRIEQRLGATNAEKPVDAATSPAPSRPEPMNDNWTHRWRGIALSAIAASLLLVASLTYTVLSSPEPQVIAVLMNAEGQPVVMIEDFGNDSAKVVPLVDVSVPADRSLQVWTLPSADLGPVSLGVLDGWNTVTLDGPALPSPQETQLYEITIEPAGGSPTGRPTGPILGKGFASIPR
ncbi:anti-sigma factor [Rhizobium sp. AAP43]|uniref:anti-sigma factor n=1 Tax=Rhizobium sp. AAP43 TaxID=1523420 RepID=UPI0006B9FF15|nr:anti-sigma factor [Rhizobium sp. AAP43]KPF41311.1 anti-sigma factor [Rhizobium sp. AAP43]